MRIRSLLFFFTMLLGLQFLFAVSQTHAFIARHYTLQEVLAECSNIVFGTVTSVNQKRMTAKVKVEENLKGESDFEEIKINLSTGQGNFPEKMIKKFKVGKPIIIFYKREGRRIPSLGHVDGTWFQTFAQDRSDKSRVWWNFTHIEIYMHRTYKGSTPDFQRLVRDTLAGRVKPANKRSSKVESLADASCWRGACTCPLRQSLQRRVFLPCLPSIRSGAVRSFTKGRKIATYPPSNTLTFFGWGRGKSAKIDIA